MTAGRPPSSWIFLCAAALVLVQLGGMAHLAVAPHGVCWEHGVLVDVDAAPAPSARAVRAVPPGLNASPALAVRAESDPHCAAVWVMRAARAEVRSSWVTGVPSGAVTRPQAPEAVHAPDRWALRSAPKQSPPV